MRNNSFKLTALAVAAFLCLSGANAPAAQPAVTLPRPGVMVELSPAFAPSRLIGISVDAQDPFKFDVLVQNGKGALNEGQKKEEYLKLIKYFLASLTVPDKNQWVNLSPYEKKRIISRDFGRTEMGRDLLAQDYLLKQITSSLMYPERGLGRVFWERVRAQAQAAYGITDIPVATFNKVWILPDEAVIYEHGNTAYVLKSHLKVMLEEDYLAITKNQRPPATRAPQVNQLTQTLIRTVIIPALEKEVNEGKNFAPLRQIVGSMLLATWYKKALKQSLLAAVYADRSKVKGVDQDPKNNTAIYRQYLAAFKQGVYNYIKEEKDERSHLPTPRKYFAGGFVNEDHAQVVNDATITPEQAALAALIDPAGITRVTVALVQEGDQAMSAVDEAPHKARISPNVAKMIASMFIKQKSGGSIAGVYRIEINPEDTVSVGVALGRSGLEEIIPNFVRERTFEVAVDYLQERDNGRLVLVTIRRDERTGNEILPRRRLELNPTNIKSISLKTPLGKHDRAMNGGIDLDAAHFNMDIRRDGNGVVLPVHQQDLDRLRHISGFVPDIRAIAPVQSLPLLEALKAKAYQNPS